MLSGWPKHSTAWSRRLKILIADDNRDAVATLTTLLEAEGHEVRGVDRSTDVLGAESAFRPDVVILDLQMPDISGYDLARWIRSRHGKRCPVLIAVSGAFTRPADAELSRANGFNHYLAKPYAFSDLVPLLARNPSQ
jgi:DNA-binding response OmpR family regulator